MKRSPHNEIALASQYQAIGNLLRSHLTANTPFKVVWEVNTGTDAIEHCAKHPPTVLVLSPSMKDISSVEVIHAIRENHPTVKILIFAGVLFPEVVHQMLDAGVHSIVGAHSPLGSLVTGITLVVEGGCYFDGVAEALIHAPRELRPALSQRERVVLRLIAEGFSTKEVASELDICVKTAGKFRERIMSKLNLHDVVKLTRYAIRNGIAPLD